MTQGMSESATSVLTQAFSNVRLADTNRGWAKGVDINQEIDLNNAATTLASRGRVQIHDFVSPESAITLHDLLQQHDEWYLSYNEGADNFETSEAEFAALTLEQKHRFTAGVYRRARSGFQYLFKRYYISQAVVSGENQGHPMHAVQEWVTGDNFLGLMR